MININSDGELPPSHISSESRLFQKLFKNRNQLEVNHDVLYRKYFDHTGKVTSRQIVVSDNFVKDIIDTLHDKPMQRHSVSSKLFKKLRERFSPRI